jgi:phosphoribosylaminoimidazolecarboxamide formyltransferase/IMP cyclohydrolase
MVTKHLKSNGIALFKEVTDGFMLVGAGMGNPNRLVSISQAVAKAKENNITDLSDAILVSDAFFPFSDNIEATSGAGIKFIIQPGGSIKDKEVIEAADKTGTAMIFSGRRHFRH